MVKDEDGRAKLYADIAHPINSACREMIQERVIRSFDEELERSKMPGYVSSYDDFDVEDTEEDFREPEAERGRPSAVQPKQVQQAETPRGPHKAPSRQPSGTPRPRSDEFGAGIFDD
jgi:stage V sporulation protein G